MQAKTDAAKDVTSWPTAEPMRSERLRLEPLTPDHAEEMVDALSASELYAFIGGTGPSLPELQRLYILQAVGESPSGDAGWLNWIVRDEAQETAVGYVQATVTVAGGQPRADLAWLIRPDQQRQGLATEAARAMVDWLAAHGVSEFRAAIHPDNTASNRVAERLHLHPSDEVDDGEVIWCSNAGSMC
jgi:RimJ/RimL family protein N-acetyltransferase